MNVNPPSRDDIDVFADDEHTLLEYERQFRRAGLPTLTNEYSAKTDVFTRAAPFLLFVLMFEPLTALDQQWGWFGNLLVFLGGSALIWTAMALLSRLRSGTWSVLPKSVGKAELAFFIIVPALVPLLLGGDPQWSIGTAVGNAVLLIIVYVFVSNGFFVTAWAAFRRSGGELSSSLRKLTLALPILLVFSIVLFVNADMWKIFDKMHGSAMIGLALLFGGLIIAFISLRVPPQVRILENRLLLGGPENPKLSARQRRNVAVLFIISQLMQILVVCTGVAIFFIAFGVLTVSTDVLTSWDLTGSHWLYEITIGSAKYVISGTHLRVSVAISTFTGLYYAISIMANDSYRDEFLDGMTDELQPIFASRARYLWLLES